MHFKGVLLNHALDYHPDFVIGERKGRRRRSKPIKMPEMINFHVFVRDVIYGDWNLNWTRHLWIVGQH